MEQLEINTALQISRPREEVFRAIIEAEKMSNYFISGSSGRMEKGKTLHWKFPEFNEQIPVKVTQLKEHSQVSFQWEGAKGKTLEVSITLFEMPGNSTLVRIWEGTMENDQAGIQWLKSNTEGWANFLACLKAYLEHGINLRKGAFEFLKA